MNNKTVMLSLIGLVLVIVFSLILYFTLFINGSESFDSIIINKVTVSEKEVIINGGFSDSSRAYKKYDYTLDGEDLYVSIKSVLVSDKYKDGEFQINIPVNGTEVNNIYLLNGDKTKAIYSK